MTRSPKALTARRCAPIAPPVLRYTLRKMMQSYGKCHESSSSQSFNEWEVSCRGFTLFQDHVVAMSFGLGNTKSPISEIVHSR